MAKLARVLQKIFGSAGGTTNFARFGSQAAGAPVTTKDLDSIQSLSQYDDGWQAAAPGNVPPYLEDRNGLDYLIINQLKYLFQAGIPEYIATEKYYANHSIVQYSGSIYQAVKGDDVSDDNTGKTPSSQPLWWRLMQDVPIVDSWNIAEAVAYDTPGVIVERFGTHYASSGKAANSGKDPIDPQNASWWIASPGRDKLIELFNSSRPHFDGMHPSTDYSSGDYQQNILLDKFTFNAVTYNFYRVMLDGTQVTGDTTLNDTIFQQGTAKEYPWIDQYAPDNVGTRTLIDMRERSTRAMGAGGGNAPTLAEVQEDAMQGHWHEAYDTSGGGADTALDVVGSRLAITSAITLNNVRNPISDTVNGTPRTGSETRIKALVRGVDYIIVMVAQ
jgi:hypothetical protein